MRFDILTLFPELFTPFLESGVPMVVVDNRMQKCDIDTVTMNNVQGAYLATHYLAECGYRKIGHLQSRVVIQNFVDRHTGYEQAIRELSLSGYPDGTFKIGSTAEKAYMDMKELLAGGTKLPQAFFAMPQCAPCTARPRQCRALTILTRQALHTGFRWETTEFLKFPSQ